MHWAFFKSLMNEHIKIYEHHKALSSFKAEIADLSLSLCPNLWDCPWIGTTFSAECCSWNKSKLTIGCSKDTHRATAAFEKKLVLVYF